MKKENGEIAKALILLMQISITILVPMLMCFFVGVWLDKKLDTNWIAIAGFVLGVIAGLQNVYRLVKRYFK